MGFQVHTHDVKEAMPVSRLKDAELSQENRQCLRPGFGSPLVQRGSLRGVLTQSLKPQKFRSKWVKKRDFA